MPTPISTIELYLSHKEKLMDVDRVTYAWWVQHAQELENELEVQRDMNKLLIAAKPHLSLWREACESFAQAFELDGFGDVRSVNITKATEAYKVYEEAVRNSDVQKRA